MPRLRPADPSADPMLSKLLWQALGLALMAVVLPPLCFGQALLGPAASLWLPTLPALALLTLHRRALVRRRGQITFPPAKRRVPSPARGKCALTPSSPPANASQRPHLNRARRGAFARVA